jgi:hypothetical protein
MTYVELSADDAGATNVRVVEPVRVLESACRALSQRPCGVLEPLDVARRARGGANEEEGKQPPNEGIDDGVYPRVSVPIRSGPPEWLHPTAPSGRTRWRGPPGGHDGTARIWVVRKGLRVAVLTRCVWFRYNVAGIRDAISSRFDCDLHLVGAAGGPKRYDALRGVT